MLDEFLVVLVRLHAEEDAAENHRGDQKQDQGAAIAGLRRTHRQRHREAAAEQDDRVRGAQPNIQDAAAALKRGKIEPAINGVGGKQPAEKHDFRDQEDPDAERVGFLLLLQVLELVRESGVSVRALRRQSPAASWVAYAYASSVTTGISAKFSVGGGEGVCHSRPVAPHGLGSAIGP